MSSVEKVSKQSSNTLERDSKGDVDDLELEM